MKKYLLALLLLTSVFAVAAETEFYQFTEDAFHTYDLYQDWNDATGQQIGWRDSHMITLSVPGGSTVYMSYLITNFQQSMYSHDPYPNLGDANNFDDPNNPFYGYNMTKDNYGYMIVERDANGNLKAGEFQSGTGKTKDITYYDTSKTYTQEQIDKGVGTQTTKGYELGYFADDTEIFFVMTPHDYNAKVDSYLPVHDPDNNPAYESILKSRQIDGFLDAAGNVVVNLGIGPLDASTGPGHRFVLGYEASNTPPPSGQPLPGVLTSCLIALSATGIAARRKHSKK